MFLEANTFFIKNKFETEANRFAVELLIPDDLIYRFEGYTVEQIATAMEIDVNMLKLKL